MIIDAGTTCYHVARHLEIKSPQVFTNSLPVANLFAAANRLEVVVSGGVIYPRLGVLVGPLAVEAFAKIRADAAIMSCGGITLEGITNSHGLLIEIQKAMIEAALNQLPGDQREVVVMKIWGGLTFAQIGEALGVPLNTAASRYRYALVRLEADLAEVARE